MSVGRERFGAHDDNTDRSWPNAFSCGDEIDRRIYTCVASVRRSAPSEASIYILLRRTNLHWVGSTNAPSGRGGKESPSFFLARCSEV